MPNVWGIHNDTLTSELVDYGFVSIGWDETGDLRKLPADRDGLKWELARIFPDRKPQARAIWVGNLIRFRDEMQVGDIVVAPYRPDRTINIGRITSDYRYDASAPTHRHRRDVSWLRVGLDRSIFSQAALWEIGAMLTVFAVRKRAEEFLAVLSAGDEPVEDLTREVEAVVEPTEQDADEPSASRIEQHTRDVVLERLHRQIGDQDFEEFTAALLRAMGYEARTTRFSGDGGVDVIAHRDAFGAEPPIIKVQCKHTTNKIGGPDVQRLVGARGDGEFGLFVTLGSYTNDAAMIERHNPNLRLLAGSDIVELFLAHYDHVDARWRSLVPLRSVLAVDDSGD